MSDFPTKVPNLPKVPDEAREAIARGIEDDHPICNLEDLCKDDHGKPCLSQRMLNQLESAGIITLEQLMNKKKQQLLAIPNLGPEGLKAIFLALSKYDKFREEI